MGDDDILFNNNNIKGLGNYFKIDLPTNSTETTSPGFLNGLFGDGGTLDSLGGLGGLADIGGLALQLYQAPAQMKAMDTYNKTMKQNLEINKDRYADYKNARQSLRDWRPATATNNTQVA